MLVQRAAAGDVERLHAAADREHRQVARGGGAQQRELVLVADAVDVRAEQRVALVPVGRGVEVRAAAEEQAVEAVEQRLDVVDEAVRGQHDRDRRPPPAAPACSVSRSDSRAGARSRSRAAGRRRPGRGRVGAELVRDDADQWGACA